MERTLHGNLSALETEICRAVAAAVLGDASAATIQTFPAEPEALNALKAGAIQLAIGVTPSTSTAVQIWRGVRTAHFL